jgi:hypothetical protein
MGNHLKTLASSFHVRFISNRKSFLPCQLCRTTHATARANLDRLGYLGCFENNSFISHISPPKVPTSEKLTSIVLSVLQFTDYDYSFGIFKLFLQLQCTCISLLGQVTFRQDYHIYFVLHHALG